MTQVDVVSVVCLVLGLVLTAWSAWERLGRSTNARAWLHARTDRRKVRRVLFVRPGLGLTLLGFGVFPWVAGVPVLAPLVGVVVVVAALLVLFWWGILAFPYPRRTVPGWARDGVAEAEARS